MSSSNSSVILKSYDLLKYALASIIKKIPRDQRYQIGNKIQSLISETMELTIEAYYSVPTEKKPLLNKVNIKLEILRHYLRLCYELGYYDSAKHKHISSQVDAIGREIGNWIKSLK